MKPRLRPGPRGSVIVPRLLVLLVDAPLSVRRAAVLALMCGWTVVLAVAPARAAVTEGPDQGAMVLLPAAATRIEAAFARAQPRWRLASAAIERDRVVASVCDGESPCRPLILRAPQHCAQPVGPWCLDWQGTRPQQVAQLERALAGDEAASMWHKIAARPVQPPVVAAPPPTDSPQPAAGPSAPAPGAGPLHHGQPAQSHPDPRGFWWRVLLFAATATLAAAAALWRLGAVTATEDAP